MRKLTNYLLIGLCALLISLSAAQAYTNNKLMNDYKQCLETNNQYDLIFSKQKMQLTMLKKETEIMKKQISNILASHMNFKTIPDDSLAVLITKMINGGCDVLDSSFSGNTKSTR